MAFDEVLKKLLDEARPYILEELPPARLTQSLNEQHWGVRADKLEQEMPRTFIIEKLNERLRSFKYPYVERQKEAEKGTTEKVTTFYNHLKKVGLLKWVFSSSFIWIVRLTWSRIQDVEAERDRQKMKVSIEGENLSVHRALINELVRHLTRMSRILQDSRDYDESLYDCRKSSLKQLWWQARSYYQDSILELPHVVVPSKFPRRINTTGLQMTVLGDIQKQLVRRKIKSKKLAYQLTALICSSEEDMRRAKHYLSLSPSPETVRTNDRNRRKNFKKQRR